MSKNSTYFLLSFLILGILFTGCKKEKNPCGDGNVCFRLNGNAISVTAVRQSLPNNRYRLFFVSGTGVDYRSVEVSIFGNTEGVYTFRENPGTNGDAGFQYFPNGNEFSYEAVSGTLTLTDATGHWTGYFSGTVSDGNQTWSLTDGNFYQVGTE
jgi:hypothetical protein